MGTTVTSAGSAENLDRAGGRVMRLLVDGRATDGHLSVLVCEVPAGSSGPPLHVHPGTDETFVVESGTLLVHADGRTHRLAAGGSAYVPRGTPHTFAGTQEGSCRFLTICTPGGFEAMHRDICRAEEEAGRELGPAEMVPIAMRHDWVLSGPPLLPTGQLAGGAPAATAGAS